MTLSCTEANATKTWKVTEQNSKWLFIDLMETQSWDRQHATERNWPQGVSEYSLVETCEKHCGGGGWRETPEETAGGNHYSIKILRCSTTLSIQKAKCWTSVPIKKAAQFISYWDDFCTVVAFIDTSIHLNHHAKTTECLYSYILQHTDYIRNSII